MGLSVVMAAIFVGFLPSPAVAEDQPSAVTATKLPDNFHQEKPLPALPPGQLPSRVPSSEQDPDPAHTPDSMPTLPPGQDGIERPLEIAPFDLSPHPDGLSIDQLLLVPPLSRGPADSHQIPNVPSDELGFNLSEQEDPFARDDSELGQFSDQTSSGGLDEQNFMPDRTNPRRGPENARGGPTRAPGTLGPRSAGGSFNALHRIRVPKAGVSDGRVTRTETGDSTVIVHTWRDADGNRHQRSDVFFVGGRSRFEHVVTSPSGSRQEVWVEFDDAGQPVDGGQSATLGPANPEGNPDPVDGPVDPRWAMWHYENLYHGNRDTGLNVDAGVRVNPGDRGTDNSGESSSITEVIQLDLDRDPSEHQSGSIPESYREQTKEMVREGVGPGARGPNPHASEAMGP